MQSYNKKYVYLSVIDDVMKNNLQYFTKSKLKTLLMNDLNYSSFQYNYQIVRQIMNNVIEPILNSLTSTNQLLGIINDELKINNNEHLELVKKMILGQYYDHEMNILLNQLFYQFNIHDLSKLPLEKIAPVTMDQVYQIVQNNLKHTTEISNNQDTLENRINKLIYNNFKNKIFSTKQVVYEFKKINGNQYFSYNLITATLSHLKNKNIIERVNYGLYKLAK